MDLRRYCEDRFADDAAGEIHENMDGSYHADLCRIPDLQSITKTSCASLR